MSQQTIGIGTVANDGTGDPLRTAFSKSNSNFTELYNGLSGLVAKSGAAAAHTGDTTETALATISIPANAVGANGVVRITSFWSMTSSANNKTVRVRLGGTGISGTAIYSNIETTIAWLRLETTIIAANATNSQNAFSFGARGTDGLVTTGGNNTSTVDMTSAQNLVLSGQLALGTETVTLLGYVVEFIQ